MKPLLIKVCATLAAVLAGGGLAILSPSSTAAADTSAFAISVEGPATLISHGVAVSLPVVVSCPAGVVAEVGATIDQAIGKRIASGSDRTTIECTGSPQTLLMTMTSSSNVAFSKGGTALVAAGVSGCGPVDCSSATTSAVIKIK
jgi:hypothetical protein